MKREAFNSWKFSLVFWRLPLSTQESFLYVSEKTNGLLNTKNVRTVPVLFEFFIFMYGFGYKI
jgi:hypothetical protein